MIYQNTQKEKSLKFHPIMCVLTSGAKFTEAMVIFSESRIFVGMIGTLLNAGI